MSQASPEPLPCTGARLRRLARRVTAFYEGHLRGVGIRLGQYSILVHLGATAQSLMELAERLEMDRTTLTRALRPLIASGWVHELRAPDARRRLLSLSTDGAAKREEARLRWADAQLALEEVLERGFTEDLNLRLEEALVRLKPALPEDN